MSIAQATRKTPQPASALGRCQFCGVVGETVHQRFHAGGVGYVFREVCADNLACQERLCSREKEEMGSWK